MEVKMVIASNWILKAKMLRSEKFFHKKKSLLLLDNNNNIL